MIDLKKAIKERPLAENILLYVNIFSMLYKMFDMEMYYVNYIEFQEVLFIILVFGTPFVLWYYQLLVKSLLFVWFPIFIYLRFKQSTKIIFWLTLPILFIFFLFQDLFLKLSGESLVEGKKVLFLLLFARFFKYDRIY